MTWRSCPGYYFLLEWNFLMLTFQSLELWSSITILKFPIGTLQNLYPKNVTVSFLTALIQTGRSWFKLDGLGPNWTISIQTGRSCFKLGGLDLNWTVLIQTGRSWSKLDAHLHDIKCTRWSNWKSQKLLKWSICRRFWFHDRPLSPTVQFKSFGPFNLI